MASVGGEKVVSSTKELPVSPIAARAPADCYEIDPLADPRWEQLVQNHPRASVFHSTPWLSALRSVYGYRPVAVTACPPGAPLTNGLVFCDINSWLTGRRFVSLPFSDHCDPLIAREDELDALLSPVKRLVDGNRKTYLEIRPWSCEPSSCSQLEAGISYCFHRLELHRSTSDLFHSFHKDCVQRKIRRAEREKLRYEEGSSEGLLRIFYQLFVMTRRRQYLPPQSLSWFRGLIAAFGEKLKIRVAYKEGLPIASILTLSHKGSMVYKYGCSNAAFNNLGGTALLFWRTIQEAKEQGYEELDFGRSETDNLGLIVFKEHWGASRTRITYWTYPHEPASLPTWWKKRIARRLVSVSPDLALKTVGKLLYRHIG